MTTAAAALTFVLACPQCGAPSAMDTDAVSFTCGHCRSFLVVSHPGREPSFTSQLTVTNAEEVRDIVILYRVQAYRAEVIARWGQEDEEGRKQPPPEAFIEMQQRAFEERLRERLRVTEAFCVHVPYWHLMGSIVQAILGRERSGPKEMRLRAFAVEHTVPGYDEAAANLRDRGLRMAGSRLQPLTRARVAELAAFLPRRPLQDRTYAEVRKWQTRDLDPDLEPVTKTGAFLFVRRFLVYRPYWVARTVEEEDRWVLVDGTFGTIAGYPDVAEVRTLRRITVKAPAEDGETRALVRASRCPDCGAEQTLDGRARVAICGNCHLGLAPTEDGITLVSYDHGAFGQVDLDAEYVPFWSFSFAITPQGSAPLRTLAEYARAVFPQGLPPGFAPSGDRLFVPAFRLLGSEPGDHVYGELLERLHQGPPEVVDGKVPLGGSATFHDVTVPESEAKETVRFVLYGIHGRASAARLNTLLLKRLAEQPALAVGPGRIVMLPFHRTGTGDGVALPDESVAVPQALMAQGPEMEALRATVYQPKPAVPRG